MTNISSILKIFYKPGQVFRETKDNKINCLLPLLLLILIYFVASYLLVSTLIIPDHLNKLETNTYLSQEEKDKALDYFLSPFHNFSTFLSTAFSNLIYYPILSFFLTLLPLLFGGKAIKYFKIFSSVIYIGIIKSIGFLLDTYLKLKYLSLDIGLNLALFFERSSLYLNSLLAKINIIDFWLLILLTILLSVYYEYSKRKSFLICFSFWTIIKVILAYFAYLKEII